MSQIFWLRAETKENEHRRVLVPSDCKKLIDAGHKLVVEDWRESIFPSSAYREVGCEIVAANSWQEKAPKDAIVIGLKALNEKTQNYSHCHIYFAHAYKEQEGWSELLSKFKRDGGRIIDLEYMVDEHQRRVCAFGYWAGYVGAALGSLFCFAPDTQLKVFSSKELLVEFVKEKISGKKAKAIVMGAKGRSGTGACELLKELAWTVEAWDKEETQKGGPFEEILHYDLLVNCVLAPFPMPPFLDHKTLEKNNQLKVISDVSCDPDSECNMLPLYKEATSIPGPLIEIGNGVKLTAIDNLPSLLPKESSEDFSSQLVEQLIHFNEKEGPMATALDKFHSMVKKV